MVGYYHRVIYICTYTILHELKITMQAISRERERVKERKREREEKET